MSLIHAGPCGMRFGFEPAHTKPASSGAMVPGALGRRKTEGLTALVIGAGFAGLSAAAGLSKSFAHVVSLASISTLILASKARRRTQSGFQFTT